MADLMYGSGLRLPAVCRLRVKDLDFDRGQIVVREGKGDKDRVVPFPRATRDRLLTQVERVRAIHRADLAAGFGRVWLPHALSEKDRRANRELGRRFLFPSSRLSVDPRDVETGPPSSAVTISTRT